MKLIQDREGSVLMIALITVVVVAGMGAAYLTISASESASVTRSADHIRTLYIAESGIAAALVEIRGDQGYYGPDPGNLTENFGNGFSYAVTVVQDTAEQMTITAIGQDPSNNRRSIEVVMKTAIVPLDSDPQAAVTSMAPVTSYKG